MVVLWVFAFVCVGVGRFVTFDLGVTVAVVNPGVDETTLSLTVGIFEEFWVELFLLLTDLLGGILGFEFGGVGLV